MQKPMLVLFSVCFVLVVQAQTQMGAGLPVANSNDTIPLIRLGPGLYCNSQASSARFFTLNLANQSLWSGNLALNATTTQFVSALTRSVGFLTQVYNNFQFPSNGGGGGGSSVDPTKGPMAWTWANTSIASPLPWVAAATEQVPCSYLPPGLTCFTPYALNQGFNWSALDPVLRFLGQPQSKYSWQVVVGVNGTGGLNLVDTYFGRAYLFLNSTCDCQSNDAYTGANITAPPSNCRPQCASPVGANYTGFNYYLLNASTVTPFSAKMTLNLLPLPLTEPRYATPLMLPSPLPGYYAIGSALIVVLKIMAHYGDAPTKTLAPILGPDVPSLHRFSSLSCDQVSLLPFSRQAPTTVRDLILYTGVDGKFRGSGVGGLCSDAGRWRLLFLPPKQELLALEDLNTTVWVMRSDSFGAVQEFFISAFLVIVTKYDESDAGTEPNVLGIPALMRRIKENFDGDAPVRNIDNLDYARWNSSLLQLKLEGDENHYFDRGSCSEDAKEVMCDPMAIGGAYIRNANVSTTSAVAPMDPIFAHYCGGNTSLSNASLLLNTAGIEAEAKRYAEEMEHTVTYKYLGIFPLPETPRGFEWTRTDSTGAIRKGWHPLNSPFSLRDFGASANLTVDVVNETSQITTVNSTARCEAITLPTKCPYKPCIPIDETKIFRDILPWLVQVMKTDRNLTVDYIQAFLPTFKSLTNQTLDDIELLLLLMETSYLFLEKFVQSCLLDESCGLAGMFALEKVAAAHLSQNPLAYFVTREDLISMIPGFYIDTCLVLDDVVAYAQNPITKATCTAEGTLVWTPWNTSSQGRLLSVLVSNRSILMNYYNITANCSSCLSFIAPHMHPIAKIVTLVASVFAVLWCVAGFGLDAALERGNCNPRLASCWAAAWGKLARHDIAADKETTQRQYEAELNRADFTRKKLAIRLGHVIGTNIPMQHPFLDYYLDNLSFSRCYIVRRDARREIKESLKNIHGMLPDKINPIEERKSREWRGLSRSDVERLVAYDDDAGTEGDTTDAETDADEGTELEDTCNTFHSDPTLSEDDVTAGARRNGNGAGLGDLTPIVKPDEDRPVRESPDSATKKAGSGPLSSGEATKKHHKAHPLPVSEASEIWHQKVRSARPDDKVSGGKGYAPLEEGLGGTGRVQEQPLGRKGTGRATRASQSSTGSDPHGPSLQRSRISIADESQTAEQLLRDEMLGCKKQLDEDRTQREPMSYFENVFERALCPPQWFLVIGALYCLVVALASIQHAVTEPTQFQHLLSRGLVAFFPFMNCLALPITLVHICLRQRSLGLPILKDNILRGLILLSLLPLLCCFLGAILYYGVPIFGIVGAAAVEYGMSWLDRQVFLGRKLVLLGRVVSIPRVLRIPIGILRLLSRVALYFSVAYFGSLSYNVGALYLEMQQQPLDYLLQYEADSRVIYCGWRQLYDGPFVSVLQVIPMIPFPPF